MDNSTNNNAATPVNLITASEVTVEVTDAATGQTFRRTLPIDYYETATLLRLSAEDMDGNVSQLVFYTSAGMDRLGDMVGLGPNESPCGGHDHEHCDH